MSDMSNFEQALKDTFPLRSQITKELKPRTAKILCISGDLIDALEKDGRGFPMPCFTSGGFGSYTDLYGLIIGSDEWETKPEGSFFPHITALFKKDPVTWKFTCEIKEENQQ